jgi:NADPH:quinone reductase-like Zn-dependent oxidoreductase
MKQIWIPKIGAPEMLEIREASDPIAGPGEVRIRVKASGINFADILARQGLYPDAPKLPAVVGYEVAGIVDQVGAGVMRFKEGDAVGSMTGFGGYSDLVVVHEFIPFPKPGNITLEQCAAIPVNYLTAWLMLIHQGNLKTMEKVLIHAVAGGVGQAAVQISRWRQAEIFGTASAGKHARLKEMGVHHCIDYHQQDFEAEIKKLTQGRGVDLVLDAVGGNSFKKSYRCLAPLGKLIMFGISSFSTGNKRHLFSAAKGLLSMPSFKPIPMLNKNRGVFGFNLGHLMGEILLLKESLDSILNLVSQGVFVPVVDRSFPFTQAAAAHAYIQAHKNFGKVLLVP